MEGDRDKQIEEEANRISHLSPSTCQSYRKCGKQVYFNKVLGIQNPQQYAMTIYGSAMHKAIEELYKNKLSLVDFRKVFVREWEKNSDQVSVWKTDTTTTLLEQGIIACNDFYKNIYGKYNIITVEHQFNIDRGDGKYPVLCFADAITKDKKIIDYKFGRGLSGTASSKGYTLNMMTYAWAYQQEYGELPTSIIFIKEKWKAKKDPLTKQKIYSHDSFVIDESPVFTEDIAFYKDVYDNVEAGIKAGVFLPADDESFFCKSCGYRIKGYCNKSV